MEMNKQGQSRGMDTLTSIKAGRIYWKGGLQKAHGNERTKTLLPISAEGRLSHALMPAVSTICRQFWAGRPLPRVLPKPVINMKEGRVEKQLCAGLSALLLSSSLDSLW